MLLEVIANVVPHGQLASDIVPSGSEGISWRAASYEIGLPTCVVNCRYSRSEPKRMPHWGQSLGKSPSIYDRTISTTSSSFISFSHPRLKKRTEWSIDYRLRPVGLAFPPLMARKPLPAGETFTLELDLMCNAAISAGRTESSND